MACKIMRIIFIFLLFTSSALADKSLKISCLNMLTAIGEKHDLENFRLDVIHFEFLDKKNNSFKKIQTKDLIIGDNYFTAKLNDYEMTFQNMIFKDDQKERMMMSKYDIKNHKYTDHYFCDYSLADIK